MLKALILQETENFFQAEDAVQREIIEVYSHRQELLVNYVFRCWVCRREVPGSSVEVIDRIRKQ